MITVTEKAVKQLQEMLAGQPGKGLRLFVETGGCAGMQYGMEVSERHEGDALVENDGVRVWVDGGSASYLRGSTIDYVDELAGAGFRIQNPNAARSCGCGTSFETAAAAAGPGA